MISTLFDDLTGFKNNAENIRFWNEQNILHREFLRSYPLSRLSTIAILDYVQGFGPDNKSFCYELEWGTKILGHVQGATVSKFGVWYDKKTHSYDFAQKYGSNLDAAFNCVQHELNPKNGS